MGSIWRASLCRAFTREIDGFELALRDCPEELWGASLWRVKRTDPWVWPTGGGDEEVGAGGRTDQSIQVHSAFWSIAYHALYHLDFYLSRGEDEGFAPPAPFRNDDHDVDEYGAAVLPRRVYTRAELLDYVAYNRRKVRETINALTDEEAERPCGEGSPHVGKPFADLLLGALLHTKDHGTQLTMFLGQRSG